LASKPKFLPGAQGQQCGLPGLKANILANILASAEATGQNAEAEDNVTRTRPIKAKNLGLYVGLGLDVKF